MNKEDRVREILGQAVGEQMYDIIALANIAYDMIKGDRLTIKILSRNVESLTMQMKGITQVTFERDKLQEEIEGYKDRLEYLKERLAKYE